MMMVMLHYPELIKEIPLMLLLPLAVTSRAEEGGRRVRESRSPLPPK